MDALTDQQLLRNYAESKSDAAFSELVRRHVDLVYSAALRMVRDSHAAKDVTQEVFVALAKNARQLSSHPVLAGWLHQTTRNLAANAVRASARRGIREQEAATMSEILASQADADWELIAPQLDDALSELSKDERDAILLRYFQRKSAQEMAETLGISAEAAQKRLNRAVEKMRDLFAKRGVAVGAAGLAGVVAANAVQAAPAGLAASIAATAGIAATTLTTTVITKAIAMTTMQKTLVAVVIAGAIGTGIYQAHEAASLRSQIQAVRQEEADEARRMEQERAKTSAAIAALTDENGHLKSGQSLTELLKMRSELGKLKQKAASAAAGNSNSATKVLADLMNNSDARKLARIQIEEAVNNKYASLSQQLNLSPETKSKFVNLIVDAEMNKKDLLAQVLSGDMDAQTGLQSRDQVKSDLQTQLTALLGDSGYEQYNQFTRNSNAGDLVKGLNQALGENALNSDQSQQIQALFAAKPEIPIDDMDLFRSKESLDALFQTLVDRGHSDLQQAASFLSPQQLSAAYTIQSNYFNSIRTQLTLGQQMLVNARK
jgi:RNA polymerase sigma factor (sigma-70 family)